MAQNPSTGNQVASGGHWLADIMEGNADLPWRCGKLPFGPRSRRPGIVRKAAPGVAVSPFPC